MPVDLEVLRQASAKDPTQLVRYSDALVAHGLAEDAVLACRQGLLKRPDDVPLRLALGRALSAAGHLEEAQAALLDAAARERKQKQQRAAEAAEEFDDAPTSRASLKAMKELEAQSLIDDLPLPGEVRREARRTELGMGELRRAEPQHVEPRYAESQQVEPRTPEVRKPEPERKRAQTDHGYPEPLVPSRPEARRPIRHDPIARRDEADTDRNDTGMGFADTERAVDLETVAARLMGGANDKSDWPADDVVPTPPVDEMTRAWDARRARTFLILWIALGVISSGIVGGVLYRNQQRRKAVAALVARADQRQLEASYAAEMDAREDYAAAMRMQRTRAGFAQVANANARLTVDHGEDLDAAAWAMLKRAEKEQKRHPEPDARADRDQRQARALMAIGRGEPCTATVEEDGDIAARCALQKADVEGARKILGQLVAQPDARAIRPLLALGSLELGAGDLDAADRAYGQVLAKLPGHPRALIGRALVTLERGETPELSLPPTVKLGPTAEAWLHLAAGLTELARPNGSEATASAELDQARKGTVHDGRLALLYGRARLQQGKVSEAEQAMRVAERLDPNDGDVAVLDAEVALAKGFEDKVATSLAQASSPRQLAVLGRAQCLVGRYREAEANLKAALARRPGDATATTYLAIARAHLGDAAGAQKSLEKAAATLHATTPHYGLGLLAWERKDLTKAKGELEKALEHNSESFRARALLGRVLGELGKPKEALVELERVSREAPALLVVHAALGKLYLGLGRWREARAELSRVLDSEKASVDDKLAFAEATVMLGLVGEGEQAIAVAQEAGALAPKIARLRLYLQSWKGPQGALLAARTLEKERKGPAARDARLAIAAGDAWRRAGNLKQALDTYAAGLYGDALHANLGLGRVSLAQGDLAQAEASFRAALDAHARGPYGVDDAIEARVGLARALIAKKSLEDAIAALTPALTADPQAPEPHYWLARAHAERKEDGKARAEAERATNLDDGYADAFLLLGDLHKSTDAERAKRAYQRYLELSPSGKEAKAVKKWLASAPKSDLK